jgi:hypothetical protein
MSVTIPNSVTTIGDGAFRYCFLLTSITIGNSVTSIGAGAFADCNRVRTVICQSTVPPVMNGINCFESDVYDFSELIIPKGFINEYLSTNYWYKFKNIKDELSIEICDVNNDNEVNIADLNAVIDIILGGEDISNGRADVNRDGEVNIADINTVIDSILSR